jgi:hypothetical protein
MQGASSFKHGRAERPLNLANALVVSLWHFDGPIRTASPRHGLGNLHGPAQPHQMLVGGAGSSKSYRKTKHGALDQAGREACNLGARHVDRVF